jgi:hypothetical protein
VTELALSLELESDAQSALLRALTLLHRRRCRVVEARYDRTDHLTVVVQAPSRHAHCVQAWLSSLVDVAAVTLQPPSSRL